MFKRGGFLAASIGAMVLVWSQVAKAENSIQFGDVTVHYNAFTSDTLSPEVATRYGFVRSKNRAMLNVTVLRDRPEGMPVPVTAEINATATNLNRQLRTVALREIRDREAIYYIGDVRVADGETLNFSVQVKPEGDSQWHRFSFDQKFYTR